MEANPDLSTQLSRIFSAGLDSDPDLRASLVEALSSSTPPIPESSTKTEANYRLAERDSNDRCDTCTYYHDSTDSNSPSCDVVTGRIDPNHVSDFFRPISNGTNDSKTRDQNDGVLASDIQ